MSNVWYTSDLHFGHRLVAAIRGFKLDSNGEPDVEAHDAYIIRYWRETVNEDDLVFILGDLSVTRPDHALAILSELPGRKVLVSGNHDPIHPDYRREAIKPSLVEKYNAVFIASQPYFRRKVNQYEFLLSHFPYFGDHKREDRFDQYRLRDYGVPLLHGHTHNEDERVHDGYQMHVGWDAWKRFINQDEVAVWLGSLDKVGVRK